MHLSHGSVPFQGQRPGGPLRPAQSDPALTAARPFLISHCCTPRILRHLAQEDLRQSSHGGQRKFDAPTEDAVSSLLEKADYRTVYFEQLDWASQVQLIAGAESIACLHGAGLANLVFSRARSLLEFQNPIEARPYFALLARELDIDYAFVVGNLVGSSAHYDNITIDLQAVKNALQ
jgi:Glycosyltransferase 61